MTLILKGYISESGAFANIAFVKSLSPQSQKRYEPVYSVGAEADAKAPMEGIPGIAGNVTEPTDAQMVAAVKAFVAIEGKSRPAAIRAALRAALAHPHPVAWQTMDSAPKDGTDFLGYSDAHGQRIAYWTSWRDNIENQDKEGFRDTYSLDRLPALTHWQPLPAAPVVRSALIGGDAQEGV